MTEHAAILILAETSFGSDFFAYLFIPNLGLAFKLNLDKSDARTFFMFLDLTQMRSLQSNPIIWFEKRVSLKSMNRDFSGVIWSEGGLTLKISFLLHLINTIGDWVGKIVSFVMVVIIGYMMASVILRYFFKSPTDYLTIVPNIFYLYVSFGAAYAYNQKIFMNVDVFYRLFSPRKRAAIDLITSFFFFLFVISLLWLSGQYALKALPKIKFDWEMLINPARWPAIALFPIGLILLLISGIARFARNLVTLLTGEEAVIKVNEKTAVGEEKV